MISEVLQFNQWVCNRDPLYHVCYVTCIITTCSDRSGRYAALGVLLLRAAKNTSPQRTYFRLWSSVRTTSNWVVTLDLFWSKESEPSVFRINTLLQDCLLFIYYTWKFDRTLALDFSLLGGLNRKSEFKYALFGKNYIRKIYSLIYIIHKTLDRP